MNNNKLINYLENKFIKKKKEINYNFKVGYKISVYYNNNIFYNSILKNKFKSQIFTGYVISIKGNNKFNKTFIVRKIINNIGVEIIYFLYSPFIEKIIVNNKGKVKKSKLYYIRKKLNFKIKNRD